MKSLGTVSRLTKGTTDCALTGDANAVTVTTCRDGVGEPIVGAACFYDAAKNPAGNTSVPHAFCDQP